MLWLWGFAAAVFVAVATLVVEILTLIVAGGVLWWATMVRHEAHVVLTVVLVTRVVEAAMLHHSLRNMWSSLGLRCYASLAVIGTTTV